MRQDIYRNHQLSQISTPSIPDSTEGVKPFPPSPINTFHPQPGQLLYTKRPSPGKRSAFNRWMDACHCVLFIYSQWFIFRSGRHSMVPLPSATAKATTTEIKLEPGISDYGDKKLRKWPTRKWTEPAVFTISWDKLMTWLSLSKIKKQNLNNYLTWH